MPVQRPLIFNVFGLTRVWIPFTVGMLNDFKKSPASVLAVPFGNQMRGLQTLGNTHQLMPPS